MGQDLQIILIEEQMDGREEKGIAGYQSHESEYRRHEAKRISDLTSGGYGLSL